MGKLILSVDDTGEGMDEEAMAYAFSVRDDLSPAGAASGAGMGLYIAQGIAHLHGGAIVLLSRPGEGTSVRVTLPAGGQLRLGDCAREPARGSELLLRELSGVLSAQAYDVKFRE